MANETDVLLKFCEEHWAQARQSEDQRSTMANFLISIFTAGFGFIIVSDFAVKSLPIALFLIILGILGALFSMKLFERWSLHVERIKMWTEQIDRLNPEAKIDSVFKEAQKEHKRNYPRMSRIRLYRLWIGFYVMLTLISAILVIYIIIRNGIMDWSIIQISNDLIAAAIWSIFLFFSGFIWSRVLSYIRKNRPVKRFWLPILSGNTVIILPNPRSTRLGGGPSMWDSVGLAYLVHCITSIHPLEKLKIVPSSFTSGEMMNENLILIASPYSNEHVGNIFASPKLTTEARFESNILLYKDKKYEYSYDNEKNEGVDYALILVIPNPYNPNKTAVILAGCAGFGTYEAQKFISTPNNLRKILKGKKRIKEIILRVTVKQFWPIHSEILHVA